MKIISVVGARPNFMKVAPISKKLSAIGGQQSRQKAGQAVEHLICHTGQHYDEKMSKIFFDELDLPKPNFYLGVGSGSHADQTTKVMVEFEKSFGSAHNCKYCYGVSSDTDGNHMVLWA